MKKILQVYLPGIVLLLLMTACGPILRVTGNSSQPEATPVQLSTPQAAVREADVQSIEIQFGMPNPDSVRAIVRGNLPDSCTELRGPTLRFDSGTFYITVMTASPADRGCAQIVSPYEVTIPLDTTGLAPGTYKVSANGVSSSFIYPASPVQTATSLQLVVRTPDGTLKIANLDAPLNPTARPTFNEFLPSGGSASGNAYVLDSDQGRVVVTDGKVFGELEFIQSPATYGLAVWPGDETAPARLAWATQNRDGDTSSTIKISALDGSLFETLLTQEALNPPSQLIVEFWSADGEWLYFSKEPLGLGGYILFGGGSSLYKINVATREIVDVITPELIEGAAGCLDSISADFRYVADHCSPTIITVRDLSSDRKVNFIPPAVMNTGFPFAGSARFSPDGTKLAYAIGKGNMDDEQGWIAVSDTAADNSRVILTSQAGSYFTVVGWLDDQTLLVQSTDVRNCSPYCAGELLTVGVDGTNPRKVADGSFLAVVPNDAFIQLPAQPPPANVPTKCSDAAKYIDDDGKDGTTYAPNKAFTKTWTVENTGTCTWNSSYLVYQTSGALMTQQPGYWLVEQGQTVAPGQSLDISIGMTTPPDNGNYRSYWVLKNEAGEIIPLEGGVDNNSFYVDINVDDGKGAGAVTATSIDIVQEQGSGEICSPGATYFVYATISTDGPTTVSYEIGSSAGQISAGYFEQNGQLTPYVTGTSKFQQADTKTIKLRFVGPYPYPQDITIMLRVNGGEWISTKLKCN